MTTKAAKAAFAEQVGVALLPHVIRYHEALRKAHDRSRCPQCGYANTMNVTEAEHQLLLEARRLSE